MKKTAYFFSSFLPIITAVSIQFLASFFTAGIAAFALLLSGEHQQLMSAMNPLLSNTDFNACLMVIYSIISILLFGTFYYSNLGGCFLPKVSRTFHPLQLLGVVILVPGAQFACSYLTVIVSSIVPRWLEKYEKLLEQAGLENEAIGLLLFLYSVLLGPICEELIFRGVTLRLARKALPFWFANLLQAVLFGIYHMNWIQGIYAFALGILLGYICEKGGSIYYSILLHILFNFWGTIISPLLENVKDTLLLGVMILCGTFLSLAVGMVLFYLGTRRKELKNRSRGLA